MIFLSYSWAEGTVAHDIYGQLQMSGLDIWIDYDRLSLGFRIEPQLFAAVASSDLVVVLDSLSARKSRWVNFELAIATAANVPIIRFPERGAGVVKYCTAAHFSISRGKVCRGKYLTQKSAENSITDRGPSLLASQGWRR